MTSAERASGASWLRSPAGSPPGKDEARRAAVLDDLQSDVPLHISACGRQFFAPVNVAGLAQLCSDFPDAVLLAGGTDVGLWVTKQHRELNTDIYVGNVTELQQVLKTNTQLQIGAAVSLSVAMEEIAACYPPLEEMFLRFASPPIRNAGTLGGNVANGSPIGDSMPALLVLGASVSLRRGEASRVLPLEDFYIDYMQNELQPGEFLEKIVLPLPSADEHVACYKISKRFDQDISARLRGILPGTRRRCSTAGARCLRRHGGNPETGQRLRTGTDRQALERGLAGRRYRCPAGRLYGDQ